MADEDRAAAASATRMADATPIELVCLDMAGTTVADGDAVMSSFERAARSVGLAGTRLDDALAHARATMGSSKIDVFRAIVGDDAAPAANTAFEAAYDEIVASGGVAPEQGAEDLFEWCRDRGVRVCLTTGFAAATRDAIVDRLGWRALVDLALSPADAGRGRPAPDMVLTAVIRLGIGAVAAVAVAGDTVNDVLAGRRAGASVVAGVLTGAHTREQLLGAGATHVLASVADLREVIGPLVVRR